MVYTMGRKEISKALKIHISLPKKEHVKCMCAEIDFLLVVSRHPSLFTPGPILNNAIRR